MFFLHPSHILSAHLNSSGRVITPKMNIGIDPALSEKNESRNWQHCTITKRPARNPSSSQGACTKHITTPSISVAATLETFRYCSGQLYPMYT